MRPKGDGMRWVLIAGTLILWVATGGRAETAEIVEVASEGRQPQAAVDDQGRIFVTFGVGSTIRLAVSDDRGRTFRAATTVESMPALSLGMRRGPRIAVTDKAVVITAVGGREGKGKDGDLLAWRSINVGQSWTGPTRLNSVEGSAREGLHGMAAGSKARLFVVWLDLRNQGTEIFGTGSDDGGETWRPDHLIYRSPDRSVCECCHPSVAYAPDGTLYVMWRNQLKGDRDMFLTHSSDGGKTFALAKKLGRGSWPLNACPMDGGAISAGPDKQVSTVWMRTGSIFECGIGKSERQLARGVQGWTASGRGGAYTLWLARRPGPLMVLRPRDLEPRTIAENATDPVVAAGHGPAAPVIAVWEASRDAGGIDSLLLNPGDGP